MKRVKLGEVARLQSGGTPDRKKLEFYAGDIPWITGADMRGGHVEARSHITELAIANSATNLVPAGTVLLVTRTAVGKVAVAPGALAYSQDITAIHPADRVNRDYLVHFLRSSGKYFERHARGATIKGITRKVVADLDLPLPSLPEQRRIADILDKADAIRAKRREAIVHLDTLAQSIFHDMFGVNEFNVKRLDELAEITSGITKGRKVSASADLTEKPYLAVVNVQDKKLILDPLKTILVTQTEIERFSLAIDDLLLTEGGDPDKLGRGVLWDGSVEECLHQNHVFRVRLREGSQIDPLYLNWVVSSERLRRYFLRAAKKTTGIASINKSQLSATPVSVPPLELQREFARRIKSIDAQRERLLAAQAADDELFASLQDRAFKGEL